MGNLINLYFLGHEAAVSALVEAGADTSCLMNGDTALKVAEDFMHDEVAALLRGSKDTTSVDSEQ
jgi:hypothetical protein